MASDCLGNILKICGIKGKHMPNVTIATSLPWSTATVSIQTSLACDEFNITDVRKEVAFTEDALVIVCALKRLKRSSAEIVDMLSYLTNEKNNLTINEIEILDCDRQEADKIYRHFGNKFTMMQLRGQFASEFQMLVERLGQYKRKMTVGEFPPLVSLVKFYDEDQQLKSMTANAKSLPALTKYDNPNYMLDVEAEYVGEVVQYKKNAKIVNHFWKTPDSHLVRLCLRRQDQGISAWKLITKLGKIKLSGSSRMKNIEGTDFVLYETLPFIEVDLLTK